MKSNSFEKPPFSTFILGRNITLDDCKPLMLIKAAQLDDIILKVKWNDKDFIMPMIFNAYFYGRAIEPISIEYKAINNNTNDELELWNSSKIDLYKEFTVLYIKFEYRSLHSGEDISLNIAAYVFEDEKEKLMYAERENDIRNGL